VPSHVGPTQWDDRLDDLTGLQPVLLAQAQHGAVGGAGRGKAAAGEPDDAARAAVERGRDLLQAAPERDGLQVRASGRPSATI